MTIRVRPLDLISDRQILIDTAQRYLNPLYDTTRLNWLYEQNPHGRGRAWLMSDANEHVVIGMAAAFPRRIFRGEHEETAWVLGDFCIDDRYRSLGPALKLQKACLDALNADAPSFCYDFPSLSMLAVYKRLRINPLGRMLRFAKPLRIDRKVRNFVKIDGVARALAMTGNLLLRTGDEKLQCDPTVKIDIHTDLCGAEFTVLSEASAVRSSVCIKRSADYLNWRYIKNPLHQYELYTARLEGQLRACAVFLSEGEDARLIDLFGLNKENILGALVATGVTLMRARGVQTLSAVMYETHPWCSILQRCGFEPREASPLVVYSPPQAGIDLAHETSWFLMEGDRDS